VAVTLAAEGCIAETVSTQLIAAARERATDRVVREVLATIAREEAEHVELAWRSLAWLLRQGGAEVRAAVAGVFSAAHTHVGLGASTERDVPETRMADHGYLTIAQRRQLAHQTLRAVVLPAARTLLAATDPPARATLATADPRPSV
jgi:hypothetical protein